MPRRIPASEKQRDFFAGLSRAPHLILSMRERPESDAASVNAHGRFQLLDVAWPGSADAHNGERETLLAFAPRASFDMADTGEPLVHLHVDWSLIRYAWIGTRPPTLIGTNKEVVLCREKDKDSRVFWFNLRDWSDLSGMPQWPQGEWIALDAPEGPQA
jgi:hypothetical protein